jgi:hypothetical protein
LGYLARYSVANRVLAASHSDLLSAYIISGSPVWHGAAAAAAVCRVR